MKKISIFHAHSPLRIFGFSVFATVGALVAAGWLQNLSAVFVVAVLILLELTFSFDNAVINAKILRNMSDVWQKIFLTVGIVIAVLGMRIVFPIVVVALSAQLPVGTVIDLALKNPHDYANALEAAHPALSAFGGAFLCMLCFGFLFDRQRQLEWIPFIERPLKQIGHPILNTVIVTGTIVALSSLLLSGQYSKTVAVAGVSGMVVYLVVHGLAAGLAKRQEQRLTQVKATGLLGLYGFIYLELIDASFSFDGVIGAFAITDQILLIAAGLGVGAVWVRSLTVYMVRRGTLDAYRYLDHGAHYAIGALALVLLFSITLEVPEYVSGGVGMLFIGSALVHSLIANRRELVEPAS